MDNYDYDEEYEEEEEEQSQEKEKTKTKKKSSSKKGKTKRKKGKKKNVYKKEKTFNGCLTFILSIIILLLMCAIIFVLFYDEETNTLNTTIEEDSECISEVTSNNVSGGLSKCSTNEFTLYVTDLDLKFTIINSDEDYQIEKVYYNEKKVSIWSTGITKMHLTYDFQIKSDDVIYLLFTKANEEEIIIVLDDGKVIYSNDGDIEYLLGESVTYKKYTSLGLEEIKSCDEYETNNQLEDLLWTEGKLIYSNGTITTEEEQVYAKDKCN